jgi:hypothetical protein
MVKGIPSLLRMPFFAAYGIARYWTSEYLWDENKIWACDRFPRGTDMSDLRQLAVCVLTTVLARHALRAFAISYYSRSGHIFLAVPLFGRKHQVPQQATQPIPGQPQPNHKTAT